MVLFNSCPPLLIMVTLCIIGVNRCLSVNNQDQGEEKSSNIVEIKNLEVGESSKMGEEQKNAQWPPGVEHAFTQYLPSELEKMDTVWHKLMAQIEAMFLLNPPYEASKLENQIGLNPHLANFILKSAELAIQLKRIVEEHNLQSTILTSEDRKIDKALKEKFITDVYSYVEFLVNSYQIDDTITPDLVRMDDDDMKMHVMIDLVRQGLAKQMLEMSLLERTLAEMRAVQPLNSWIKEWSYDKDLLYSLFFIELQKIADLRTLDLLKILKNKPKEVQWPKSVEDVNKVNKVLTKFERLSNFAEYASLYCSELYLYWFKSGNSVNHLMQAKFVKVANLKAKVGQITKELNLQNN